MKLLTYTMLFPNRTRPHYGVFVKERLARYRQRHGAEVRVVAPTPLLPGWWPRALGPASWDEWRGVPLEEEIDGFPVAHPRFLSPPGVGDGWRARLQARGAERTLVAAARAFQPDILDVHYAYPDGAAAARLRPRLEQALGRRLPMVLTVRGTDLNLLPELPAVRDQIAGALQAADHVVCVADALRDVALELGASAERTTTLRNGVDADRFTPGDRAAARQATGLPAAGRLVLCVGHLIERKGQHLLIEAFARTFGDDPETLLVLVGDGERRADLTAQVTALGLSDRVVFVGAVEPGRLPDYYRAADVSVLASSREGWANVVLESLACGTPIIATRVWGTPEILNGCAAGHLVDATVDGLAGGLSALHTLQAAAARPWAERHGWEPTLDGLHEIFTGLAATLAPRVASGATP